ncbi:DNA polymerase [Luteimonas aestuarii]|uniref:DNA polymerase n=1 Tax=Luteimonas aestuarii TaxID=453837 RepID=A0A4R5TMT3_9GAMM|nr:DNA polymerase [Luteimonas aestuarii]TDK23243.1 DNA polymerase [Luteimonas aestuarii]
MTLRCLFVDFNSFFAAVEQQDEPRLRGRPVGIVPVMSPTTCCIAASAEAKDYAVRTGTPVWEAVEKCPGIILVEARPARYVELHHRLMNAIGDCIPHGKAESIDEVPCWLVGRERERDNAIGIAHAIKRRISDEFDWIKCSIGIAPNRFLAKTASDMSKRDGLTVLAEDDLPHALHVLELRDFCGIGPSMEQRLRKAGIHTAEQLCAATREHLRAAWGSLEGERYWMQLRGHAVPERSTRKSSIGHSHVLDPALRTFGGARAVLFKLLAKAAMRLRDGRGGEGPFLAAGMSIRIRFVGMEHRFERDLRFAPIDDTPALLQLLAGELASLESAMQRGRWNARRNPPLSVAVTLVDIELRGQSSGELMPSRRRDRQMTEALDRINRKYGNNTLFFGAMHDAISRGAAPMRIPFQAIPERERDEDVLTRANAPDSAEALYLLRERQFKVLAEASHREAQRRGRTTRGGNAPRAGAGGWGVSAKPSDDAARPAQRTLF